MLLAVAKPKGEGRTDGAGQLGLEDEGPGWLSRESSAPTAFIRVVIAVSSRADPLADGGDSDLPAPGSDAAEPTEAPELFRLRSAERCGVPPVFFFLALALPLEWVWVADS